MHANLTRTICIIDGRFPEPFCGGQLGKNWPMTTENSNDLRMGQVAARPQEDECWTNC